MYIFRYNITRTLFILLIKFLDIVNIYNCPSFRIHCACDRTFDILVTPWHDNTVLLTVWWNSYLYSSQSCIRGDLQEISAAPSLCCRASLCISVAGWQQRKKSRLLQTYDKKFTKNKQSMLRQYTSWIFTRIWWYVLRIRLKFYIICKIKFWLWLLFFDL